jgi:hypothetical protein
MEQNPDGNLSDQSEDEEKSPFIDLTGGYTPVVAVKLFNIFKLISKKTTN